MEDGRVLVNAGGRVFETTALTLKTCGAGYFEALLGETGAKLPGRKRARVSADGDDAPGGGQREIFIDRDPDRFADVLSFMRSDCLPAAAAKDLDRLHDLRVEAEFLAYDALLDACDKALDSLAAAAAAAAAAAPRKEYARNVPFFVKRPPLGQDVQGDDAWGEPVALAVPRGQVCCITAAVPISPLKVNQNWILRADKMNGTTFETVVVAYISEQFKGNQTASSHCDMRFVLQGGDDEIIIFDGCGCTWSVNAWVGHASKIPCLASRA